MTPIPCPFCGKPDLDLFVGEEGNMVRCNHCEYELPHELWQQRPLEDNLHSQLKITIANWKEADQAALAFMERLQEMEQNNDFTQG